MAGNLSNLFKFDSQGNLLQLDDLLASGYIPPQPVPPEPPVVHDKGNIILNDNGSTINLYLLDNNEPVQALYIEM